jgi:hypothetical protein
MAAASSGGVALDIWPFPLDFSEKTARTSRVQFGQMAAGEPRVAERMPGHERTVHTSAAGGARTGGGQLVAHMTDIAGPEVGTIHQHRAVNQSDEDL